jgi:DNA primase
MAFPSGFLDEIKNRVATSDVVGRKVKLQRRGREFVGLSPFKQERTPSFTVNDDKQFYHCFSTGKHGSIFDFLMETEGVELPRSG